MEMVVVGESLRCKAFSTLLHGCLRALIDQLAVTAFNVSILNISVKSLDSDHDQPIIARYTLLLILDSLQQAFMMQRLRLESRNVAAG